MTRVYAAGLPSSNEPAARGADGAREVYRGGEPMIHTLRDVGNVLEQA
ncbi:hypothetical protein [Nocardia alni]|nr:hypothetical protein [Nocardia alni]